MAPVTVAITVAIDEKRYSGRAGAGPVTALRGLRACIGPSEFCVVTGPSGCGKTTLLNIIAGLDRDFSGTLSFAPSDGDRPRIGYVFQSPRLLPWRTVRENVALVQPHRAELAVLERLLADVGMADMAGAYPVQLSGGMARRAALARAFAIAPDLLLMDEPFLSLDAAAADHLRSLLLRLVSTRPATVLFVTHDFGEAVTLADRILVLSPAPGRVMAEMPIALARTERGDPDTLSALRAELARLADHPIAAANTAKTAFPQRNG